MPNNTNGPGDNRARPQRGTFPGYREQLSPSSVEEQGRWLSSAATASLEALLSPDATLCRHLAPGAQLVVAAWLPGVATCTRFECAAIFDNVGTDDRVCDRCGATCGPLGVYPLGLSSLFFSFAAGVCRDCLELQVGTAAREAVR